MRLLPYVLYGMMLVPLLSCSNKKDVAGDPLFTLLTESQTNISFYNLIQDSDSLNILNYEYLYNGGGIAAIDINNDGLKDLYFSGNQVSNALYLNEGDFSFKDISQSSGTMLPGTWCTGISVIDINRDGFDDLYVCVGGPGNKSVYPNKLLINNGDLTFSEMAMEYGLADANESMQAQFFDYDRDGDLDMYLLTGGGFERSAITTRPILDKGQNRNTDHLYQNNFSEALGHPVFTDVSQQAGIQIEGFGLGVSVIDVNNDGWSDVFVSNDYMSRDLLYVNNKDGSFTDQSLTYFRHTSHFSMGNDIGDINNDGYFDIISVDMLPEDPVRKKMMFGPNQYDRFYMAVNRNYGYQYMRNMLHLNRPGGGFSEIGQLAGIHSTDWTWGPLLADFDNDGFQDLFVTNGFGKDVTDLDFIKFRKAASSPFSQGGDIEKLFMDSLRNRPSITLPNYMYQNGGNLKFDDKTTAWGFDQPSISNGVAYGDLDNDGDLDLVINNLDRKAFVYENRVTELDSMGSNYIRVLLSGNEENPDGYGAIIKVYGQQGIQSRTMNPSRGFLSSVEQAIHFGLGAFTADSLQVIWPDGMTSWMYNLPVNAELKIDQTSSQEERRSSTSQPGIFTATNEFDKVHKESDFNDFRTQPLLLNGFSRLGPGIAVADVNGDQLEDVFIGGAYGQNATLYTQTAKGAFIANEFLTESFEDLGALFVDVDSDGDEDLYVVSGGSERYNNHENYQDRLYLNDGTGQFTLDQEALPEMLTSTSVVVAADFDIDGDLDLFVGGRVIPGRYPETPKSYLLRNDGGRYEDITDEVSPRLANIGMVTSAVWTDFNNDSQPDLVLVGEAMRISLFKNEAGMLSEITDQTDLAESYGMWNSITAADLDNDGDMDLIAGNIGENIPYDISAERPLEVFYSDFDGNGAVDPIFTAFEKGTSSPVASLDQLTQQLPGLKKYILHYRDYARADKKEILKLLGNNYQQKACNVIASSWVENLGNDTFKRHDLPIQAQFAPVNGIAVEDVDSDGLLDLMLVGNSYNIEVVNGRYDASIGTILLNRGDHFISADAGETNFLVEGDSRGIVRIETSGGESILVIARNNESPQAFRIDAFSGVRKVKPTAAETSAILYLKDGSSRKVEFARGSGYLSQGSRQMVVSPQMERIELFGINGKLIREITL